MAESAKPSMSSRPGAGPCGLLQVLEAIGAQADLAAILDGILALAAGEDAQAFSFVVAGGGSDGSAACARGCRVEAAPLGAWEGTTARAAVVEAGQAPHDPAVRRLWTQLGQPALIFQPVTAGGRALGVLGIGRRAPEPWPADAVELAALLAGAVALALSHDRLAKQARELSIRDELTGVYNEAYLRQRLQEEIRRAAMYQRPCAYAVFAIRRMGDVEASYGRGESEQLLKRVAQLVQHSVSDVDRVGRVSGGQFAVVLPERSKREALEIVERIRQQVQSLLAEVRPRLPESLAIASGVAENPLDGNLAEVLMHKAAQQMMQQPAPPTTP
jgi:diguanylate cyclase (GGDEF)-like protein